MLVLNRRHIILLLFTIFSVIMSTTADLSLSQATVSVAEEEKSTTSSLRLLPILRKAFPTATGYESVGSKIEQGNADGQLVSVQLGSNDGDGDNGNATCVVTTTMTTKKCFVKTVDAKQYYDRKKAHTRSGWPDFRRTAMYLRTEVRFYREVLPDLLSSVGGEGAVTTPEIFAAAYNLDGLLTEAESATDDPLLSVPEPESIDWEKNERASSDDRLGGYIVMSAVDTSNNGEYYQDSPVGLEEAKKALAAFAALHAAA